MNTSNKADLRLLRLGLVGLVGDFKGPDLTELNALTQTAKRCKAERELRNRAAPLVQEVTAANLRKPAKADKTQPHPKSRSAAALNRIHYEHQFEYKHLWKYVQDQMYRAPNAPCISI